MASRISEKKIMRELRRITESIPVALLDNLLKKEVIAPTIKELIEKALTLPESEVTPEQRARFQNLIDSGVLDKEVEVINKDGEEAISKYIDAELALAVKLGRLPKEAPMPPFIRKKGIKYAKRQRARLEKLYSGSAEEVQQADDGSAQGKDDEGDRSLPDNDPLRELSSQQVD